MRSPAASAAVTRTSMRSTRRRSVSTSTSSRTAMGSIGPVTQPQVDVGLLIALVDDAQLDGAAYEEVRMPVGPLRDTGPVTCPRSSTGSRHAAAVRGRPAARPRSAAFGAGRARSTWSRRAVRKPVRISASRSWASPAQPAGVAAQRGHRQGDRGDDPSGPVETGAADQLPPHHVPHRVGARMLQQPLPQRRQRADTTEQTGVIAELPGQRTEVHNGSGPQVRSAKAESTASRGEPGQPVAEGVMSQTPMPATSVDDGRSAAAGAPDRHCAVPVSRTPDSAGCVGMDTGSTMSAAPRAPLTDDRLRRASSFRESHADLPVDTVSQRHKAQRCQTATGFTAAYRHPLRRRASACRLAASARRAVTV